MTLHIEKTDQVTACGREHYGHGPRPDDEPFLAATLYPGEWFAASRRCPNCADLLQRGAIGITSYGTFHLHGSARS